MKQGHPLKKVSGFDLLALNTLRDRLSVTTAEEFLHAATAHPDEVAEVLSTDRAHIDAYAEAAAAALGPADADSILNPDAPGYRFRTGHDTPPPERRLRKSA